MYWSCHTSKCVWWLLWIFWYYVPSKWLLLLSCYYSLMIWFSIQYSVFEYWYILFIDDIHYYSVYLHYCVLCWYSVIFIVLYCRGQRLLCIVCIPSFLLLFCYLFYWLFSDIHSDWLQLFVYYYCVLVLLLYYSIDWPSDIIFDNIVVFYYSIIIQYYTFYYDKYSYSNIPRYSW